MDGKTLEQIRGILMKRWDHIGKGVTLREIQDKEFDAPQAEIIDIAQNLEQIGREASLAEQERRELIAVERALNKMTTGNFGICEDCSEEIPAKRLMVLPEARLCAHCQAFEEKQMARSRVSGFASR